MHLETYICAGTPIQFVGCTQTKHTQQHQTTIRVPHFTRQCLAVYIYHQTSRAFAKEFASRRLPRTDEGLLPEPAPMQSRVQVLIGTTRKTPPRPSCPNQQPTPKKLRICRRPRPPTRFGSGHKNVERERLKENSGVKPRRYYKSNRHVQSVIGRTSSMPIATGDPYRSTLNFRAQVNVENNAAGISRFRGESVAVPHTITIFHQRPIHFRVLLERRMMASIRVAGLMVFRVGPLFYQTKNYTDKIKAD